MSLAVLVAALFAVLSVLSAQEMAPDREVVARQAALLAVGAPLDEFCGPGADGQEHRCPFCHKLPEPPCMAAPDNGERIARVIVHRIGHDLVSGPQDIRVHAAPRAPPRIV